MATRLIYAEITGTQVAATGSTYASLDAGSGLSATTPGSNGSISLGQNFATPTYGQYEVFYEFYTADVEFSASSPVLNVYVATDGSTTDFTANARLYDWSGSSTAGAATTAAWQTAAQLAALPLLATFSTVGIATGANVFTDVALAANISTTGYTRIVITSDRREANTTPTTGEFIAVNTWQSTTSASATNITPYISCVDDTVQTSSTINTGTTSFTPVQTGIHDMDLWGAGGCTTNLTAQEGGGGGGMYCYYSYRVTSLSAVTVSVAGTNSTSGGAGSSTTYDVPNKGSARGGNGTGSNTTANALGLYGFAGGQPVAAQGGGGSRGGSGGSSSASTTGTGVSGTAGSGSGAGSGGVIVSGVGGNGGNGGAGGGGAGQAGSVPGGGGGGGGSSSGATGNGAAGRIIVYYYPAPTPKRYSEQRGYNFAPHRASRY